MINDGAICLALTGIHQVNLLNMYERLFHANEHLVFLDVTERGDDSSPIGVKRFERRRRRVQSV